MAKSHEWAGIAFCHGCDTTNNQYDIWKYHVKTDFLYWINTPAKNDLTAMTYHEHELRRFIAHLETRFQVEITNEKLKEAIRISNRIKRLMRELSTLRVKKDIPNGSYYELARKCVQMQKPALIVELETALGQWKSAPPFPAERDGCLF